MPSWKTYCIECPSCDKAAELKDWIQHKSEQDGCTPFMNFPETMAQLLLLQEKSTQYVDCGIWENMVYAHTVFFLQDDNFLKTIQPYWTRSAVVWFDGRTETATEVTLYRNQSYQTDEESQTGTEENHQQNDNNNDDDDEDDNNNSSTISVIQRYEGNSGYGGLDVVVKVYLDHGFRLRCYACTCPTEFPMTTIPGGPIILQFETRDQLQKALQRPPTAYEESLFGLSSSASTTTTP